MITSSDKAYRERPRPLSRERELAGETQQDPIAELARARFGVAALYPIQRFVVSNVLEGNSQIVILPTGAGKSICFQLPALILPRPTLVLMPLLSLLSDQLRKLQAAGIPVAVLRGGMGASEKQKLWSGLRSGGVRLLLATPEACLVESHLAALRSCDFGHLVVDEAHCIIEWGAEFRPAYREIDRVAKAIGVVMISAFTATASTDVIERIRANLFPGTDVRVVEGGSDRPCISYSVRPVLSRGHELEEILREARRPLLIFCRTRSDTESAARRALGSEPGRPVSFYHAGLSREERASVEAWFLSAPDAALFSTSAYGMGVDKPDIRTVVHAHVPPSVEAYLQESGRAGRDGKPSRAILLSSPDEEEHAMRLTDAVARHRFDRMLGYAQQTRECRRNTLLSLIGQPGVACSGCDVCDGTARSGPTGATEIVEFIRRNRRRFRAKEAAAILTGATGPQSIRSFHDCLRGWRALAHWDARDVETAIRALAAAGMLRVIARGPWKERLTIA
jgi:ATP-dependent DNA helicase RecQ